MANTPLREAVRHRIRVLRVERGLTQEALCERAGISLDSVNRIENGSRVPTLDTLERLAEALETSVAELVRVDEPARRAPVAKAARRVAALVERQPPHVVEAIEVVVRAVLRAVRAGGRRAPR